MSKQSIEESRPAYAEAAANLMTALSEAGCGGKDLRYLTRADLKTAGPILLEWLPRVQYQPLKSEIVRVVSKSPPPVDPCPIFLEEFRTTANPDLRWLIASGLERVAKDAHFEHFVELAREKRYGKSRAMLALALGRMKNSDAVPALVEFLQDEELVGHAVMALRKLKAKSARPFVEPLATHLKAWIRAEVGKALRAFG